MTPEIEAARLDRLVKAIGAAISIRNWHMVEKAHAELRDYSLPAALAAAAAVRSGPPESVEAETRRCWRIVNRAISTVGYGAGREQMIGVRDAIMAGPEGEAAIRSGPTVTVETLGKWQLGDRVRKTHGSSWQGRVVGFYSTKHTPLGYCIESEREPGSVQIYPSGALGPVPPTSQEHQTT